MATTTHGNAFALDAQGERVLLSSRGQQVMMAWERQYMERCVDALRITRHDAVLEIGFGLAYSATRIQTFRPRRHAIIECDATVLKQARAFEAQHCGVEVVEGTWQRVLPTLGEETAFDCVFFDDYPLPELEDSEVAKSPVTTTKRSRWLDFLDVVLHHVNRGARITGYLARPIDLSREGCEVEMARMHVETSSDCTYYPHDEAYVAVITVRDPALARTSTLHRQRERLERVREQLVCQHIVEAMQAETDQHDDETIPSLAKEMSLRNETMDEASARSIAAIDRDGVAPSTNYSANYESVPSRAAYLASLRARAHKATSVKPC